MIKRQCMTSGPKANLNLRFFLLLPIFFCDYLLADCNGSALDLWPNNRYTQNVDGTVTDVKTGLVWTKCPVGLDGTDCTTGSISTFNWQEALDAASTSIMGGHDDWRLPNIKELASLISYICFQPSINQNIFPNTSGIFWTSTPFAAAAGENEYYSWAVDFQNGGNQTPDRRDLYYIRLVRE